MRVRFSSAVTEIHHSDDSKGTRTWVDPVTEMAMAPRGPVLLLPLVLLTTGLAQLTEGASYQQFVNQHVDFPRSRVPNNQNYCDLLMQRRGLTRPACKPINTFIHEPAGQLRDICGRGGRHIKRNLYDSKRTFRVTTCREAPGSRPRHCRYRASVRVTRVRVACNSNLPVHLDPKYLS
ncbi:ribonuclease-like [Mauremys reevesii]|uniref:ribonuclease-like n=1 Tax=Mauremys reevesii TaxID=260615 RepID=UPI00193FAA76|nr:ribonuclease-like [Mauremys reevesii]XP_039353200.1 ribonuclease-like [Mauremys reevesii]